MSKHKGIGDAMGGLAGMLGTRLAADGAATIALESGLSKALMNPAVLDTAMMGLEGLATAALLGHSAQSEIDREKR